MSNYNIYKNISEADFILLKKKLELIEFEVRKEFKDKENIKFESPTKSVDSLAFNLTINLPHGLIGSISYFLNESETGFDVTYLVTKDEADGRFFFKKDIAENITIDDLSVRNVNFVRDGLAWLRTINPSDILWRKVGDAV